MPKTKFFNFLHLNITPNSILINVSVGLRIFALWSALSNPMYLTPNIIFNPTFATLSKSFFSPRVSWQDQAGAPSHNTDSTCYCKESTNCETLAPSVFRRLISHIHLYGIYSMSSLSIEYLPFGEHFQIHCNCLQILS